MRLRLRLVCYSDITHIPTYRVTLASHRIWRTRARSASCARAEGGPPPFWPVPLLSPARWSSARGRPQWPARQPPQPQQQPERLEPQQSAAGQSRLGVFWGVWSCAGGCGGLALTLGSLCRPTRKGAMHTAVGVAPLRGLGGAPHRCAPVHHRRVSPLPPAPHREPFLPRCGTGEVDVCASAALSEAGACPPARAGQARSVANNAYMNRQLTLRQLQNAALMDLAPPQGAAPAAAPAAAQLQMVPYDHNQGRGRGGRGRGRGGRGGRGRGANIQCYLCGEMGHIQHQCPHRGVG